MNDQTPTPEHEAEVIEFSDKDREDLAALGVTTGEVPEFHTILEVWSKVLEPAAAEMDAKITPTWANRMVTQYQELHFADMPAYQKLYFGRLLTLADIVDAEIDSDPEATSYRSPEEDVEHNSGHYKTILFEWQKEFIRWELAWDPTSETAAVEIAAIAELHKVFFGQTGITQFLDNIKFEFSDQDQAELAAALDELKEG